MTRLPHVIGRTQQYVMTATYQPRWLAWCRATGRDPDEVGGALHFVLWLESRWFDWDRLHGREPNKAHSAEDHDSFDRWLTALVEAQGKGMEAERG